MLLGALNKLGVLVPLDPLSTPGFLNVTGSLNKLGVLVPLDPLSTSGFLTINGLIIYAFLRLL